MQAMMKRMWIIWKHALGTYSEEDIADHENAIAAIRTIILLVNLTCAIFIMAHIIFNWGD